jgi:hypothetical protein
MKKFAAFIGISLLVLFAFAQNAPTLEETIAALEGGITNIPLDAAIANIEGWEEQLSGSEDPAVQSIADQLGQLREALSAEMIDGAEVGALLTSLGVETAAVGQEVGEDQLVELGNLLSEAGAMLTGDDMGVMTGGDMDDGMGEMTGGDMEEGSNGE